MLDLRGGITTIDSIRPIRLSLFWNEHETSLAQDTIPCYPPPFHLFKSPLDTSDLHGIQHRDLVLNYCRLTHLITNDMIMALTDLSVLTIMLRQESENKISWEDTDFVCFGVYPITNKFLANHIASDDDGLRSVTQEICRLGGLLFLAEVRRKFGVFPIIVEAQIKKLQMLLHQSSSIWNSSLDTIRTWVLVVAGCAMSEVPERTWIVEALVRSRVRTGYHSWQDIMKVMSRMWWIDEVLLFRSKELEFEYASYNGTSTFVGKQYKAIES
jgi:hypothetical protein